MFVIPISKPFFLSLPSLIWLLGLVYQRAELEKGLLGRPAILWGKMEPLLHLPNIHCNWLLMAVSL